MFWSGLGLHKTLHGTAGEFVRTGHAFYISHPAKGVTTKGPFAFQGGRIFWAGQLEAILDSPNNKIALGKFLDKRLGAKDKVTRLVRTITVSWNKTGETKAAAMIITRQIHFRRGRRSKREMVPGEEPTPVERGRVPRVSRLMALAASSRLLSASRAGRGLRARNTSSEKVMIARTARITSR